MMLQPKSRFQRTDDSKKLQDIVVSEPFQNALTVALAQMQLNQASPTNPPTAWDSANKMAGAKEFIHTLLNLAEKEKEPTRLPDKNLKNI